MPRVKPKKGMALLLVMTVIVVVLTTVSIGATVLLNNLDANKGQEQASIAFISAQSAIEKVRGYYKNDSEFFDGCLVNHCINFYENSCDSCDNSETMYTDGNRRYKVVITNKNASGVSIEATGYKGPYNRTISAGIKYAGFTCGDDYLGIITDNDYEGNEYPTTLIKDQCWMATSLRTKQRVSDGGCINGGGEPPCAPASKDDKGQGRSCFDNDEANCSSGPEFRGSLYTWDAAMDGSNDEGARGLCPVGWHIPTDKEWSNLENFLKDSDEELCTEDRSSGNGNEFECVSAGLKLSKPDDDGDNLTGFNSVGTGYREDDGQTFSYQRMSKYWSSTGDNPIIIRSIDPETIPSEGFGRDEVGKNGDYSFAIRCIKDL